MTDDKMVPEGVTMYEPYAETQDRYDRAEAVRLAAQVHQGKGSLAATILTDARRFYDYIVNGK